MNHMDIFNDDAFSLESLVAAINRIDHVPGRAGDLAFAGVGEGVNTTHVTFDVRNEELSLIQTSPRGSPAPQDSRSKARLVGAEIPQIKLEETISAAAIQNVRAFGSVNQLLGVQTVVQQQMQKAVRRHDLTLEYHRLGALRGKILDADGTTVILDLFDLFKKTGPDGKDLSQSATVDFSFEHDSANTTDDPIRKTCSKIRRRMVRNLKAVLPAGAQIWAFCGDNFFDKLIEDASVKRAYDGYAAAERRLGGDYAFGIFEYADIMFENYQGTDTQAGGVGVNTNQAMFFWTGVPGLYAEYFAPADFMDTVNTIGLPRYARTALDVEFQRWVKLHTQQNPLPVCLRPLTLQLGSVASGESESESESF